MSLFLVDDNELLQNVCEALRSFLNFQGRWDERLALTEKSEAKAVEAGDHINAGWRAYQAGMVHNLRQEADKVLACAERAAVHWHAAHVDERECAIVIHLRSIGHRLKQDYPAAIAACRELVELHRSFSAESKDLAVALNGLASAESASGDFAAAERDYREALRVARVVGNDEMMAGIPGNLAALALERKDWPRAETLAREALPLAEKLGRQEFIAGGCYFLAQSLVRQGKTAEALPHARRAVEIYTRLGSPTLAGAQALLDKCEAALGGETGK